MTNPFGPNPFERNPFDAGSPSAQHPPPPPIRPRDEVNTLATLSLVFAFVFAPAGAVLGHLGLSQIRRTGERGRDRALVGLTLSYVFITVAVVALVVGVTLASTTPTRIAAPTTTTTSARSSTPTTTTPPPPPTVAPADLDGLLSTLDEVKNITGNPSMTASRTSHQIAADPGRGTLDRPECWPVTDVGAPEAYDTRAVLGFSFSEFLDNHDPHNQWTTAQGVAAFPGAAAAQAQLAKLQSVWRQCGGSTMKATWPHGSTYSVSMSVPADAGNGITAIELVPRTPIHIFCTHAIATKANVVTDAQMCSTTSSDRTRQATLAITNSILGKVPG
jgi:eukaryotic-like serine/threonine-protein kinase